MSPSCVNRGRPVWVWGVPLRGLDELMLKVLLGFPLGHQKKKKFITNIRFLIYPSPLYEKSMNVVFSSFGTSHLMEKLCVLISLFQPSDT